MAFWHSALCLTSFLTVTTPTQAMPGGNDGFPPSLHTRDLHHFIEGHLSVPEDQQQRWIRASYEALIQRPPSTVTQYAKQYIGLGNLLAKHPSAFFPWGTREQSLNFTLQGLEQAIEALVPHEEASSYRKYRNYARIIYGQLVVRTELTDFYPRAWEHLNAVEEHASKVGKIYQAHLLLKCHFIPHDMAYNDRGVPLIASRALYLLESTRGNTRKFKALHRTAASILRQEQPATPPPHEIPDMRTDTLRDKEIKSLREELIQEARTALPVEAHKPQPPFVERLLDPASDIPSDIPSDLAEDDPSLPATPEVYEELSVTPLLTPPPSPVTRHFMHLERAHPPIGWTKGQKRIIEQLRREMTIPRLAAQLWPHLTVAQKSHYEKGVMDKYFHDAIGRLARKQGIQNNRKTFSNQEIRHIARIHSLLKNEKTLHLLKAVQTRFPHLTRSNIIHIVKRAKKMGIYPKFTN